MANEITVALQMAVNKGLLTVERSITFQATLTGSAMQHGVQSIGTTKEDLVLGDVATPGFMALRNLDATNYVAYGADADSPFGILKAGEGCILRLAAAPVSIKANTAAVNVEYWVLED